MSRSRTIERDIDAHSQVAEVEAEAEAEAQAPLFLDDCWTLYFHDPDDTVWTLQSYRQLGNISTVNDWVHAEIAYGDMWTKGMFFLMREHVLPLWEDPHNKNGGCLSYKINKPDVRKVWYKLCAQMLGNTLCKNRATTATSSSDSNDAVSMHDIVCGVSISPKRSYCILRIWIGDSRYSKPDMFHIDAPEYTQVLWKVHEQNNDFVAETPT